MDPIRNADSSNGASKPRITIDEFSKIEVKVGTVRSTERVPETDKLLRLMVDFNEEGGGFSIKNPNAKSTCGCGQSFSTE